MTTNRPPSCDLLPEFNELKLKPCPLCGAEAEKSLCDGSVFICSDVNCLIYGPWKDPHGRKWNSIPRRSEVLELIRLVDECQKTDTQQFHNALFSKVWDYAQKLKKEMTDE